MSFFKRYFDYIILFILIYTSRETVLFGTNTDQTVVILGYITPVIVLFLLLFRKPSTNRSSIYSNNNNSVQSIAATIILMILATMLTNLDVNVKYGYEILLCLISYQLVYQIEFKRFAKVYNDIILFLSIFATITSIVYIISPGIISVFPVITNKSGYTFYFLGLSVIPGELSGVYYRLFGIFREPGVAIMFINIALLFELFVLDRKKLIRVLILAFTVGLSLSTAGYIITFFILVTYLFHSQKNKTILSFVLLIALLSIVVLILRNDFLSAAVFDKFTSSDSASAGARFGSVTNNINIIYDNPLGLFFGMGYEYVESYFEGLGSLVRGENHNTNTLLKELSVHGLFFFLLLLVQIYKFSRGLVKKRAWQSLLVFVAFLLIFSNEDLTVDIIVYLIVFYSTKIEIYAKKRNYSSISSSNLLQQERKNVKVSSNII